MPKINASRAIHLYREQLQANVATSRRPRPERMTKSEAKDDSGFAEILSKLLTPVRPQEPSH